MTRETSASNDSRNVDIAVSRSAIARGVTRSCPCSADPAKSSCRRGRGTLAPSCARRPASPTRSANGGGRVKRIPDPPAESSVPATACVTAGVPASIPAAFASDLGWPGGSAIVAARQSKTVRRGKPRRLKEQTNQRSGNRLPRTGVAATGIPCCFTGNCGGSEHHHFGSSSSQSDFLISSVRRRNCRGQQPTAHPFPTGERITAKPRGESSSKTQLILSNGVEEGRSPPIKPSPKPN